MKILTSYSFAFVWSHSYDDDDDDIMFNRIAKKIDDILFDHLTANIHICVSFNTHHKVWLIHSNITNEEGVYCHDFSIAYELA